MKIGSTHVSPTHKSDVTLTLAKRQKTEGFSRLLLPNPIENISTTKSITPSPNESHESEEARITRLLSYFPLLEPKYASKSTAGTSSQISRLTKSIYEAIIRNPKIEISALRRINRQGENVSDGTFSEALNNVMRHFNAGANIWDKNRLSFLIPLQSSSWRALMTSIRRRSAFTDVLFNVELLNEFYNAATKCAKEKNIDIEELNENNVQSFYSDVLDLVPPELRNSAEEMLKEEIGYVRLLPYPEKGIKSEVLKCTSASTTDQTSVASGVKRMHSDDDRPSPVEFPLANRPGTSGSATSGIDGAARNPTHGLPPFPVDASGRMPTLPLAHATHARATASPPLADGLQMLLAGGEFIDHFPGVVLNEDGTLVPSDAHLKHVGWAPMPDDASTLVPNFMGSSDALPPSFNPYLPAGNTHLNAQVLNTPQTWTQEDERILNFLGDIDTGASDQVPRIVPGTLNRLHLNWPPYETNFAGTDPWTLTTTSNPVEYLPHTENTSPTTRQELHSAEIINNPMLETAFQIWMS